MAKRCRACGGVYEPVQDGVSYFHVCPPLSAAEVAAAIDAGKIAVDVEKARAATGEPPQAAGEAPAAYRARVLASYLAQHPVQRRRRRDERPPSTREQDAGTLTDPGAGVDDVPPLNGTPIITAP